MNRLAILRRVATLLFLMLTSVTLWGQEPEEPIKLFQIYGVDDFYQYTENVAITFSYTIYDEKDHVVTEYIDAVIKDKEGNTVSPTEIKNKNKYTLTVTGDDIHYTGTLIKEFYVWDTTLSGGGTEGSPYMINTEDDWIKLCASLYLTDDDGTNPSLGKYYQLGENISVETMVGKNYDAIPFRGIFDGNNDTITFNKGTKENEFDEAYCAPFRYTCGATIHDLTVVGSIYTKAGGAGGLIGYNDNYFVAYDNTIIENVVVGVNISNIADVFYDAGVVAYGPGVRITKCVYNGKLDSYSWGGGFTPYGDENTYVENCIFNPDPSGKSWGENFVSYDSWGDYENPFCCPEKIVNCYYTWQTSVSYNWGEVLSTQGQKVFVDEVPADEIGYDLTEIMGYKIYKPVVVADNVQNKYTYIDDETPVFSLSALTVTFDDYNAISNGYCTDTILDSDGESITSVSKEGGYILNITGDTTKQYYGTKSKTFYVVSPTPSNWYELQELLNGDKDTINIDKNYVAQDGDVVLTINRNVVINLNGDTLNRNLPVTDSVVGGWVLKVNKGAKVTINGPGTIMGGCNVESKSSNDGGGIHNMGNLTLNDVTVTANKCVKKVYGSTAFSARGGGIYSGNGSTFVMNGGTINHNFARGGGGGIFIDKATSCTMNGVDISGNECLDKGGGIRITGNATLINCTVRNNELKTKDVSDGGGVYYGGDGTLRMTGCRITGNQATKQGGGLHVLSGTVRLKNCEIVDNFAFDYDNIGNNNYGGGICLYGGQVYMDSVVVAGNISREDGCGIYVRESGAKLHLTGYINIFNNFKTETIGSHGENNNVYLANTGSKIDIQKGFDALSYIGVIKNGTSDFTTGLGTNGSIANFASDKGDLYVVPAGGEAKMAALKPFTGGENVTVSGPMVIDDRDEAASTNEITISGDGILYIVNSGYVDAVIHNEKDETRLIIEDGGQVVIQEDPVDPKPVPATIKKDIEDGIWYLISSAVATPRIVDSTNMVTEQSTGFPSYDLYRFNEGATTLDSLGRVLQWENYRAGHADFTELTSGRGYLYRNYYDYTITIDGNLNTGNVDSYVLSYNETLDYNEGTHDNIFKGFNIIGNPYPHNIKKGEGQAITNDYLEANYYTLLENGTWKLSTDDVDTIRPMTGILVQAKSTANGQPLTMKDVPVAAEAKSDEKSVKNNVWFTVANSNFEDRACVEVREGHGLNKIAHENENAPMLYIHHNGEDFASVDMNPEAKMFDLNFEARTMGYYTLSVKPQGDFVYLHLIDKVAGKEIDLLEEQEYSFIGTTSDAANRFVVRMSLADDPEESDNEVFAYQSGNDIVVSGEGELQVFDVTGRLVATQHVNGVGTWRAASVQNGVYIMRLNGKTQKIVVR